VVLVVAVALQRLQALLEVLAHQVKVALVETRRVVYRVGGQQVAGAVQELLGWLVLTQVRLEYLVGVVRV
jgi:hypothetical protein